MTGKHLYPGRTTVSIASSALCVAGGGTPPSLPCVVTSSTSFDAVTCVAPAGCGAGSLTVSVAGVADGHAASVSTPFEYDAPAVMSVANRTTDAMQSSTLQVRGRNFGVDGQTTPQVFVGTRC